MNHNEYSQKLQQLEDCNRTNRLPSALGLEAMRFLGFGMSLAVQS
jgi:hypothetical protein